MYVAPTPFALAEGTAHHRTLILPATSEAEEGFRQISVLIRREVDEVVGTYTFDLRSNELDTALVPNPNAGREHVFKVYRVDGDPSEPVVLRERSGEMATGTGVDSVAGGGDE